MGRVSKKNKHQEVLGLASPRLVYRTAVYVRLSVADGEDVAGDSIVNQQMMLERYILEHHQLVLQAIFIDNGETGVNFDRPAWNSLMEECYRGNIDCIVVKDLSRLGRNYIETGEYLERIFPSLGVRLMAINDCYDNLNLTNGERLACNLKNLVNDLYAKDISHKVIAAVRAKQKSGQFLGRYAAYGYLKDPDDPKRIVVNHETAPVVYKIFQMKADGLGNGAICQQLNAQQIPCPLRYRYISGLTTNNKYANCIWIISTVADILRNPLYLGHMTQGKVKKSLYENKERKKVVRNQWIVVPNTHQAIVPQELFDRANAVLDSRAQGQKKHPPRNVYSKQNKPLFYGVICCADCKKSLTRRKLRRKNHDGYAFVCKRALELKACSKKFIIEDELYDVVYHAIQIQVQKFVDIPAMMERLRQNNHSKPRLTRCCAEIEKARKDLRRLDALKQATYEDYVDKVITSSEYQSIIEKYNAGMNLRQSQLDSLILEKAKYSISTDDENSWFATFLKFVEEKVLCAEMVCAMIDRVEVDSLDKVSIKFKFRDEHEVLVLTGHSPGQ